MSRPIIRPSPVYWKGKKVAEIREGTYEIDSNDQREIAAEGYLGHTDGATTCNLQATLIVPVIGTSIDALPTMLAKKYVNVGIFEDGKLHQLEMRVVKISYTWNHEKGENRCTASLEGGEPQVTG